MNVLRTWTFLIRSATLRYQTNDDIVVQSKRRQRKMDFGLAIKIIVAFNAFHEACIPSGKLLHNIFYATINTTIKQLH